jgi:hypothetical protein
MPRLPPIRPPSPQLNIGEAKQEHGPHLRSERTKAKLEGRAPIATVSGFCLVEQGLPWRGVLTSDKVHSALS